VSQSKSAFAASAAMAALFIAREQRFPHVPRISRTYLGEQRSPEGSQSKGRTSIDSTAVVTEPPGSSPPLRRPSAETILTLFNGTLAGVAGVFVGTRSALITITAAAMAVTLAAMVLIFHR
jgi:hypothetical protein